jgi:hypothetical protein
VDQPRSRDFYERESILNPNLWQGETTEGWLQEISAQLILSPER